MFRKAEITDVAELADLMLFAMKEIVFNFIGRNDEVEAKNFLQTLISQEGNQYSYQNCWVWGDASAIQGMVNIYNGANLSELRKPVESLLQERYQMSLNVEDETGPGEYYIDTIAVYPTLRGMGIGTKILQALIQEYVVHQNKVLGLLVDEDNPKAKKLYENMGFEVVEPKLFAGKKMYHLQYCTTQ